MLSRPSLSLAALSSLCRLDTGLSVYVFAALFAAVVVVVVAASLHHVIVLLALRSAFNGTSCACPALVRVFVPLQL